MPEPEPWEDEVVRAGGLSLPADDLRRCIDALELLIATREGLLKCEWEGVKAKEGEEGEKER